MDGIEVAVRSVETVGTDTIALTLETPPEFDARPGQFVQLAATVDGEEVTRHYTLSSPDADETFETTVEVDPDGTLGPFLADLEPGDTVEIAGPFGDSYYEGEDSVVVLAGGPGVGPAVGIGERASRDGATVTVVYEDDDPVHEERLTALADAGATVVVTDDVSSEDVLEVLADAQGQTFIYGFAEFLDRATAALDAANVDAEDAKAENFGPAP
ncbi:FAD-dependent oxidoreductase [Halorussus gelatinilyticus]|uniref:FAD-dependent oxidoreductase n=1 Tax=Halorussus gelatinilyticus TaxID=2937524 RepID=A0A8U0IDF4_9EURY|nr:FAD-dependent oxidoreductase [Halorussus gelatinilyticus]UPV99086.1 FAD-dependent oxidoreductase [Halorussus gelatinilyticus]